MGAFILAGIVFVGTLALSGLMLFASMMSDSTDNNMPITETLIGGTIIAVLIAASHWAHMTW